MKYKLSIIALAVVLLSIFTYTPKTIDADSPIVIDVTQELRGVWLTPITGELSNYTSEAAFKQEMTEMFTVLEHYNINALFFHVRTHNNALYESVNNPKATWFSTVDYQSFDPLQWLIAEAKSRGLEFHAWMNPYRVDAGYYGEALPAGNPASSPANLLSYNGKDILNPGLPSVRNFVIDSVMELVENYDVDAVHFDDYFYMNLGANGATSGSLTILDEPDQATFELYSGGRNTSSASEKADWRREQINLLVSGVKTAIGNYNTLHNDYVQFGISPTGIYKNGNGVVTYDGNGLPITTGSDTGGQTHYSSYLFSDSLKWMTEGWVDYLTPQSYWATNHPVAGYPDVMSWWNAVNQNLNINLYSGIGVYMANLGYNTYGWQSDTTQFLTQLNLLDTYQNVSGSSVYSYNYLESAFLQQSSMATTQIDAVKASKWTSVAVLPELKSMTEATVSETVVHTISPTHISWDRVEGVKNYYVFASDTPLQYTSDEIVGVVGQQSDLVIQYDITTNPNHHYGIVPISETNTLGSPSILAGMNMIPGASIRTQGIQGLKYQASFDTSLLANDRGFFVVYGEASNTSLLSVITDNSMVLNGKPVYQTSNYDTTTETISVVLTGIPATGYGQKITVFGYSFDGTDYTLVPAGVTRSIGEVAVRTAKAGNGASVASVLTEIETNYFMHYMDEFDDYRISSIYETDRIKLQDEFINDWNSMFGTSYTTLDPAVFHAHAKVGAQGAGDVSGSNIYQFFNDGAMSVKWGWFLEYLKSQDNIVWPTRQILAIQGDGTLSGYSNMYDAIHLDYSITNFFNNAHQVSGYGAIDFTGKVRYQAIALYNQNIYITPDEYYVTYAGQTFMLPDANVIEGYMITGFDDGVTVHSPGALYTATVIETLETQKSVSTNSIIYHVNGGNFHEYPSRNAMVNDFILDFNTHSGKSLTAANFYDGTYHGSTNFVIDFFNAPVYGAKWSWMKTYILDTGAVTSYGSQSNLVNDTASTWRSNVWGFINAAQRSTWPVSIDFSTGANADGFWSEVEKAPVLIYQGGQDHILEIPFRLGYTFEGWYASVDFSGMPVTLIASTEFGEKAFYAKWTP